MTTRFDVTPDDPDDPDGTNSVHGPEFAPDDPLAVILRPSSDYLGPPPGRYEEIRRAAGRRKVLRAVAGAGLTCAVAALAAVPLLLSRTDAPAPPAVPMAPPPATSPASRTPSPSASPGSFSPSPTEAPPSQSPDEPSRRADPTEAPATARPSTAATAEDAPRPEPSQPSKFSEAPEASAVASRSASGAVSGAAESVRP